VKVTGTPSNAIAGVTDPGAKRVGRGGVGFDALVVAGADIDLATGPGLAEAQKVIVPAISLLVTVTRLFPQPASHRASSRRSPGRRRWYGFETASRRRPENGSVFQAAIATGDIEGDELSGKRRSVGVEHLHDDGRGEGAMHAADLHIAGRNHTSEGQ
jgi:hypothetical protein